MHVRFRAKKIFLRPEGKCMRNLFQNKPLFIALIAVLLLVILVLVTGGDRSLSFLESTFGSVIQPVQTFASNASGAIIDFFQNLFNTTDADKENQQLKIYIAQLEQSMKDLEAIRQENHRLKELLSFIDQTGQLKYVSGSVIGKSQGIWFDTFTINLGRQHGVEKNMPVINQNGLVGRVSEVGATFSKVTALVDATNSVSVMVERTRDNAMVRGTLQAGSNSDLLELYYLSSSDVDLLPGDKIVTSGVGGIYPKGITVGEVIEVSRASDSQYNAVVKPAVDFRHIEEISVITGGDQQQEATP